MPACFGATQLSRFVRTMSGFPFGVSSGTEPIQVYWVFIEVNLGLS